MNSIDEKTREVIDMYNRFPFPLKGNYGNYFFKYVLPSIIEIGGIKRILDAGCGTGNIALDMARLLPEAKIVAIDLAEKSIEIATQRAAKEDLKNIEFRKANLLEFDPTLGIFDFIYCQGVIHNLTDPLLGLRNLNRYLKPSGYAYIWLYSCLGRTRILEIRQALKVLGINELDWEQRLNLANRIDNLFYRGTWLKKLIYALEYLDRMGFKRSIYLFLKKLPTEIYLSDQILHPQDKFYRFSEAIEFFEASGFKFVKVLEGMSNTLEESFKDPRVLSIAYRLPPLERYKIIELYERPRGIGYLLQKHKDG
jgi:ubiquinone/menaquinone biosynthesis C-methylase UbiE